MGRAKCNKGGMKVPQRNVLLCNPRKEKEKTMRGDREGEAMIRMYCVNLVRKRGRERKERWERVKWGMT